METKLKKIIDEIKTEIEDIFSDNVYIAFVFGSWARKENSDSSDIDLMIIFKDKYDFSEKVNIFKEKFIDIQIKYELSPDYEYPGEYVSIPQIDRSLSGYGFLRKDDFVEIPLIDKEGWTNFNEHRQWLSALATPSVFIIGNKDKYEDLKKESLETIVGLLLLNQNKDSISKRDIINNLLLQNKTYLGFCNTPETRNYLEKNIGEVLVSLSNKKHININLFNSVKINRKNILNQLSKILNKEEFDLKSKFIGEFTSIKDRKVLADSLNIGLNFILDDEKILNYYHESDIKERFTDGIPQFGKSMEEVIKEFKEKVIDGAVHQSSPNYLAFPDSGNSLAALSASIFESFTNQNLISTTKSAPTATFLEMQVIQWLRKLIGFSDSDFLPKSALGLGGVMTTGGTLANTTALLIARCKAFPESRKKGLVVSSIKPILIIASDTLNHYSHIAGFWWLGLGEENIIFVKPNSEFRIDPEDLEKKIIENNDGIKSKVVAVVALAGDSRTTTIENFEQISSITNKHNVWLHVDACHGGVLIFSKKHKHKIKGIEKADSISIDPHKGLGIPYSSSAVLFRDVKCMELISKSTDITIQSQSADLGQITSFIGSKPFDSLKLWFLIKNLGLEGINSLVDYRYKLANEWSNQIKESSLFESLNKPDLNSIVFSLSLKKIIKIYPNTNITLLQLPNLNKELHDLVYKEGKMCIHSFDIFDVKEIVFPKSEKTRVLGVTLGNPYTDTEDLSKHIFYLELLAKNLIEKI